MGKINIDMEYYKIKKTKNRYNIIKNYIKGKDVLDLGCVNHDIVCEKQEDWLHGFVKKHAKSVLGVDYLPSEVEKLRKKGYDIICADVETMNLNKKYDVIIAGELIEHLSNFGLFLDTIKKHLKEEGIFIVTTPNAFSIRNTLRGVLLGNVPANVEHTCWFCNKTLANLLKRKGFIYIDRYYYFDNTHAWTYSIEAFFSLFRNSYAPGMMYICKKK
jgi:2-polyprenyl-3-methyl-5-hydroxy-6-metoxy-1,4-benzoquinol methylase